jgi:hypothetical protein
LSELSIRSVVRTIECSLEWFSTVLVRQKGM